MILTRNFSLVEFLVSADHPALAAKMLPDVDARIASNLQRLCDTILQPLRDKFGPLKILSGYRSVELNAAAKGSATSQHRDGCAADLGGIDIVMVWEYIVANLNYHQVIRYPDKNFVHVSVETFEKADKTKKKMICDKGVYTYA